MIHFCLWVFLCARILFVKKINRLEIVWIPSFYNTTALHQLWALPWLLSIALLFCHIFTASATVLSGHFLCKGVFYLTLLPHIWHNLLLSRLLWEPAVLPWRLQGLPLRFETQTQLICLFESYSVQQKVLVGGSIY